MATFNIDEKYSATYNVTRARKGFKGTGEIWDGNKATGIKFSATGTSQQNAIDNTADAARRAFYSNEQKIK
jgi:hypothetical protein